jgi:hypothetical protein
MEDPPMKGSHLVIEGGEERTVANQEGVLTCPCESQLFFLTDDGTVECSRCFVRPVGVRWSRSGLDS